MRIAKWQALGNHFLTCEQPAWPITPARARLLCDAALGLGADGVLELTLADDGVTVVVHNRDGSIAEVSGNGTRIAAAYAAGRLGRSELTVRTGAGEGDATVLPDGRIAVRLGHAVLSGPQEDRSSADPGVDYRFV
jgi:diaminopimelate epimerase